MNKKGSLVNFLAGLLVVAVIILLLAVMNMILGGKIEDVEASLNRNIMVLESMQTSRNFLHMAYDDKLMIDIVLDHARREDCDGFRDLLEDYFDSVGETPTDWFVRYTYYRHVCTYPDERGFSDLGDFIHEIIFTVPPMVIPNPEGNDLLFTAKKLEVRDENIK